MAEEGVCKGEICNRDGCKSVIEEYDKDGCCSCHINPPCSYCTEPNAYCPSCGWDEREEQDEYDKLIKEVHDKNRAYYEKSYKEFEEAQKLFDRKYRGEIPAEKLEIRSKGHTHFSMIKVGVFPKGTETQESILPKVKGTFGGRFTTSFDKNSYKFEYIAYTD